MNLKRKIGPVPVWAVAVVGVGGVAYFVYRRNAQAAADTAAAQGDVPGTPPTGADPSSTLPYGVTQTDPASYAPSTSGFNAEGIYTPVGYQAYNNGNYSVPGQMVSRTRSPLSSIDVGSLIESIAAAQAALRPAPAITTTSGGTKSATGKARQWWQTHKPPKHHHHGHEHGHKGPHHGHGKPIPH